MINGTFDLLAGCDGSAKVHYAGLNDFANGDNADLLLAFGSMLCQHFSLIIPVLNLQMNL